MSVPLEEGSESAAEAARREASPRTVCDWVMLEPTSGREEVMSRASELQHLAACKVEETEGEGT